MSSWLIKNVPENFIRIFCYLVKMEGQQVISTGKTNWVSENYTVYITVKRDPTKKEIVRGNKFTAPFKINQNMLNFLPGKTGGLNLLLRCLSHDLSLNATEWGEVKRTLKQKQKKRGQCSASWLPTATLPLLGDLQFYQLGHPARKHV